MGKHKAKKFGNLRPNPTGLISEKELAHENELDEEDQSEGIPSAIGNIIEKLQSPGSEERIYGCQLLANIVSQPKAIGYLLQEDVVKIAAPLFLDACPDVRKNAAGALRNLSVYGHTDVCDVMISNDVLTPLTVLIKQYDNSWLPLKDGAKYDTSTDILVEAIELLSNLCESNNLAVRCFNKEGLLSILLPFLKVETYGYNLGIASARCLHVVSENNTEVSSVCQQPEIVSELLNIVNTNPSCIDGTLFRILVLGIVFNLPEVDLSPYYTGIVSTIVDILDMDIFSVIATAIGENGQTPEEESFENERTWPEVDKLLNAQAVSLELLANICCSDDEWEDVEGNGSSESSDDQAVDAVTESMDIADTLCLSSEINSAFVEKDILTKILRKACPAPEAMVSKLDASQNSKTLVQRLHDLQSRALLCLSNIVGGMDDSSISKSVPLLSIWEELHKHAAMSQGQSDEEFRWAVTSAMRAVIQRLADKEASKLTDVSSSDLDFLISLAKDTKNRETQINVVRMISTIGCVLSTNTELHPFITKIGLILVEVACHNEDLVVISEALDSLFDMFKEDHTDPVVKEICLVEKLQALQPSFRSKISSQRKKLGENYGVVMMAKSNLAAYIKYKLSQK